MTYHTVHTPRAIPPKPAPKALAPTMSIAEDAALVRIRAHRAWGAVSESAAAKEANMRRAVEAQQRREALCDRIMASPSTRPATRPIWPGSWACPRHPSARPSPS